jgi:hypothetical protein
MCHNETYCFVQFIHTNENAAKRMPEKFPNLREVDIQIHEAEKLPHRISTKIIYT